MQITNPSSPIKKMRDYISAFGGLTGLSVSFQSKEEDKPAQDFSVCRNAFCQLLQRYPGGDSLCQRAHENAKEQAHKTQRPVRTRCPFGLSTIAVPVKTEGGETGTVLAGEVLLRPPSKSKLEKQLKKLFGKDPGYAADRSRLWNLFRRTRVVTRGEFQALGKTLQITAENLGATAAATQRDAAMQTSKELKIAIAELERNPDGEARVKTRTARRILREDIAVQIGEETRYLRLKHLGGGTYRVTLSEADGKARALLVK